MRLLGEEFSGENITRYWLHPGDDGNDRITVETTQDVEPAMKRAKSLKDHNGKSFRFKATIPGVVIDEICRLNAKLWGIKRAEVFSELMANKTSRAKGIWALLTGGRDYSKFQARSY